MPPLKFPVNVALFIVGDVNVLFVNVSVVVFPTRVSAATSGNVKTRSG